MLARPPKAGKPLASWTFDVRCSSFLCSTFIFYLFRHLSPNSTFDLPKRELAGMVERSTLGNGLVNCHIFSCEMRACEKLTSFRSYILHGPSNKRGKGDLQKLLDILF